MLKKRLVILSLAALVACDDVVLSDDLVGEYQLVIGSASFRPQNGFSAGYLSVRADGTFQQRCQFEGQRDRFTTGTWQLRSERIMLLDFDDCVDVYRLSEARGVNGALNVPLQGDRSSPLILLEPDLNVFYEKLNE